MKSIFERKKFISNYIIAFIISLLLTSIIILYIYDDIFIFMTVDVIVCILGVVLFFVVYRYINSVYKDIEHISDMMLEVIENKTDIPEEKFKQGTVGILYTNFYKMVAYLRESEEREIGEKEFLRDIISDISHQLKTPMASLNIFIDLLLDEKITDNNKKREMLSESKKQLSRMEWLVLALLKLARIEAGAIKFDKKSWNLNVIFSQSIEGIRYLTDKRNQQIKVICGENDMLVCDADWLTEAIINLVKNASDYSEEDTCITIEVEKNSMYTRIYVKDEGMGIPESNLPHIFDRFYRVNKEVNPNSVGIGLSLTKSIVEGMGGKITVRSVEGEYTWFIITFVHV